jgi:hypothetical protein
MARIVMGTSPASATKGERARTANGRRPHALCEGRVRPAIVRPVMASVAGLLLFVGVISGLAPVVQAADRTGPFERLVFQTTAGKQRDLLATVLVEAEDGGLLAQSGDGALWPIDKPDLVSRQRTETPFAPETGHVVARGLLGERGAGWQVLETKHYVVCTQTHRRYAEWCAALFERLYFAFDNHWKQRGIELVEPEFPLVALIFEKEAGFLEYGRSLGHDLEGAVGFYDIKSNRIAFYDLTAGSTDGDLLRSMRAASQQVATIIHEATHQIAFNSGVNTRLADNPLWLTEGMAIYFESPDLSSEKGWKTIGLVNDLRLPLLKQSLAGGVRGRLETLISTDELFVSPETQPVAYAQAWGLTYYLVKTRGKEYVRYLETIRAKPRLEWDTPETRRADFQAAFGADLAQIERDWLKAMARLRSR